MQQFKKGLAGFCILLVCCVLPLTACSSPKKYIEKILGTEEEQPEEIVQETPKTQEPEVPVDKPVFVTNLSGEAQYKLNQGAAPLTAEATIKDNGTLEYQWYRNTTSNNGGGMAIEGAVSGTYTPPTDKESIYYYYVLATNRIGASSESTTSDTIKITVGEVKTEESAANEDETNAGDTGTNDKGKTEETLNADSGQWKQDAKGWWYELPDGTFTKSDWKEIDGKWYVFDENGYMRTGWWQDKESWYYLNKDGSMAKDTEVEGYQIGSDGKMK